MTLDFFICFSQFLVSFHHVHILIMWHLSNVSQLNVSLKDQEFLCWLSVMKVCYNTMCVEMN